MNIVKISPIEKSISGIVNIPGSKSYTNRALFLAAVSGKTVRIIHPLLSDDTKAMIECLRVLGVHIQQKEKMIEVSPKEILKPVQNDKRNQQSYSLSANLSGTTIRFIVSFSCLIPGIKTIYGQEGLNKRPVGDLVDALRELGAEIEYLKKEGYPPLRVNSSKLKPGIVHIKGSTSSQFISSVLMIAPLVGKVIIEVFGQQGSKPYIDMTIDTMKQFGVGVDNKNYQTYTIASGQQYKTSEYTVEGDISSASYFFAIAALTQSKITARNLNPNSLQADMGFLKILEKMGNKVTYGEDSISVAGMGVKPIEVDMENCPDQVMTLGVLAAFAKGTTVITGIQSLKIKETDRLTALKQELKKMGIKTTSTDSKLTIFGGNPKPARIKTYGDHRMAMAFAVAGSTLSGMEIEEPEVVHKTFPDFWETLQEIGIKTLNTKDEKNIVLIGMRGSGKTTVAKLLSEKLGKKYIELDDVLAKEVGMSISEVVNKFGWDYFREKESEIAQAFAGSLGTIISTGGGVVLNKKNMEILKKNAVCFLLQASVDSLVNRIGNDSKRPMLTNANNRNEEVEEILKERKRLYEAAADVIINTDNLNSEQVAEKIISKL